MAQKPPKPLSTWKRTALNVFIAFHVFALFFWGLPESLFRTRMIRPFESYYFFAGLWHNWNMFAPMPLIVNFDVRAQVKYRDGSSAEWIAPRMQELPMWERASKERYRKWREKIRTDDFKGIWPETARFVARQMNRRPDNPPVQVKLTRYWINIPKPKFQTDFQPIPASYNPTNSYTYFTLPIQPEDLK
jgi:hypothetical protein